ncbi:Hsp20/alpha crystallin family protein [Robertmurraya andreesenii]|uniref:HSP20 family protein n=1 Tax=Anoxybacillus andreesenii TaxID=1325932 RepID=A0ABT9V5R5_9BACL|nr:Hsp20/alpha crystallin family protein [Robertmurraya andreesenii]MDQ0156293.1 HSP20 family protein [Robertmurraya andreesenii]
MDMDKIKQWMELAKKYQTNNFWSDIFEQPAFDDFMRNQMDFGETGESPLDFKKENKFPPTDIYMTEDEIFVVCDLAGFTKEDIRLSVSGAKLLIKGDTNRMMAGKMVQKERQHGPFERVIQLPEPTLPNQIRARFSNGVLFVSYQRHFKQEEYVPID